MKGNYPLASCAIRAEVSASIYGELWKKTMMMKALRLSMCHHLWVRLCTQIHVTSVRRMADNAWGPRFICAKTVSMPSVSAANCMNMGERVREHRPPSRIQRGRHLVCISLHVKTKLTVLLSQALR